MFMLIDCDNFFVSCERIFQPKLKNRPVVVLSNNDGCVVSRSYEAKALDIPMCCPFFKIENFFKRNNGIALSSNYELYADISRRVMALLHFRFGEIETYSIDEAFVKVSDRNNFFTLASNLRQDILNQIGIPVSIGIAKTKTLCKIASKTAKKNFKLCQLTTEPLLSETLAATDIQDIWGVGRRLASRLRCLGIFNGQELAHAPLKMIRTAFGLPLEKTVLELNQTPCLDIEPPEMAKSLISSGSFEVEIQNYDQLKQNLAEFVDCACLRLRRQQALANGIWTELHSNRFNPNRPRYDNARFVSLDQPSDNTADFMNAMKRGLDAIYRPDCWYKRAGVTLVGLEAANSEQQNWLVDRRRIERGHALMQTFDEINRKHGRKTIFFAAQTPKAKSYLKREFKSPNFTTSWNELPKAT